MRGTLIWTDEDGRPVVATLEDDWSFTVPGFRGLGPLLTSLAAVWRADRYSPAMGSPAAALLEHLAAGRPGAIATVVPRPAPPPDAG